MGTGGVTISHLQTPPDSLIEEIIDVYVGLEKDNRAKHVWVAGDQDKVPELARALMTPHIKGVGDVYTARNETAELVGFALWTEPGKCLFSSEDQMNMGYSQFLKNLPPEGAAYHVEVMGKHVPAFISSSVGIENAPEATYWCDFLYVRRDYQRKGIATAFVRMVQEKAAQMGATMALTTQEPENVRIYEKLGFSMVGHQIMPSPWGDWPEYVFAKPVQL